MNAFDSISPSSGDAQTHGRERHPLDLEVPHHAQHGAALGAHHIVHWNLGIHGIVYNVSLRVRAVR